MVPCRRSECDEQGLWRGLCARHWARWQEGEDPLEMPDDEVGAPAPSVWQPPLRANSVSQRRPN